MNAAAAEGSAWPVAPRAIRLPSSEPGVRLRVWIWERNGGGIPVVLLHGFGMSARVWETVVRLLGGARAFAPDARGHGGSDTPRAKRPGHASGHLDLAAVVDALKLDRFALVGHSMGAYAAIRYAAMHPERVDRLALLDAGPDLPARGEAPGASRRRPPITGFESEAAYAAALAVLYPRVDAALLDLLAHEWLQRRPDGRYEPKVDGERTRRLDADARRDRIREESQGLWDLLASLSCPTLIVRGGGSRVLSASTARRMREVLCAGRLIELADVGHALMLEAPQALAAALAPFLSGGVDAPIRDACSHEEVLE